MYVLDFYPGKDERERWSEKERRRSDRFVRSLEAEMEKRDRVVEEHRELQLLSFINKISSSTLCHSDDDGGEIPRLRPENAESKKGSIFFFKIAR